MVTFTIPIKTSTPGNNRKHWAVESKNARAQRDAGCLLTLSQTNRPPFPVKVTLTRTSPRTMDKHNLPGAMKHIIDGIADAYDVDDGDERWQFVCEQRKSKEVGVEVVIEPADTGNTDAIIKGLELAATIADGLTIDRFGKLAKHQVADAIRAKIGEMK